MKRIQHLTFALATLLLFGRAYAADSYQIDKAHSNIGFSVKHLMVSTVRGNFSDYDAAIQFDENDLAHSSINATIQVASISTNNEKRDAHLRSADFFAAEEYPAITFVSSKIEKSSTGYVAHGKLTMRGVTKEVDLPFQLSPAINDPWGNKRVGVEAALTVNRLDYGISWNKALDNGGVVVSNEVKIELSLEAIQVNPQSQSSK